MASRRGGLVSRQRRDREGNTEKVGVSPGSCVENRGFQLLVLVREVTTLQCTLAAAGAALTVFVWLLFHDHLCDEKVTNVQQNPIIDITQNRVTSKWNQIQAWGYN